MFRPIKHDFIQLDAGHINRIEDKNIFVNAVGKLWGNKL